MSVIVLKMEGERRHVTELMCRVFLGRRQVEKGVGAASGDRHGRRGEKGEGGAGGLPFMRGCSSCAVAT